MTSAPDGSGWKGRPLQDVIPWAEELLEITTEGFPVEVSAEDRVFGYSCAYVARASALLRSMVVSAHAEDRESIPIVYRVLFETWLFAVYLIKGGELVLKELDEHLNYEQGRVTRALALTPPSGDSQRLSVETVARKVREQLGDDFPTRAYDIHYRVTSYHWSHGHLGSLTHFFFEDAQGTFVDAVRVDADALSSSTLFLAMGVSLVGGLANLATTTANAPIDKGRLSDFLNSWQDAANNYGVDSASKH